MRSKSRIQVTGAVGIVVAVALVGCGANDADEPSETSSLAPSPEASGAERREPARLPGAMETNAVPDSDQGAESESSGPAGVPNGTPEPGPDDVAGSGVVVPSPSPAVDGDGLEFDGFLDQSTVDRSSASEVAIEAMRGLSVWDTTVDTKPGDAGARVDSLISDEALERGVGGPGRWTPMWWRQATAAGAWSSAETNLVPLATEVEAPEGVELLTVEVSWEWHADEDHVVPEGGAHSCTVAVEQVNGQQTVTAFDCQDAVAETEDMSS